MTDHRQSTSAEGGVEVRRRRPRRTSPAQRAKREATRRRLLQATARVIGESGFERATIEAITSLAEVGHGAFYLHFTSRQHAFDELLRTLGDELVDTIGSAVREAGGVVDLERRGLAANLAYSEAHPDMNRVMTEAELYAPDAYRAFMGRLRDRYVRSLRRSMEAGEINGFAADELETVAVLLMGMRRALIHAYCLDSWQVKRPPPAVVETMLRMVAHGLSAATGTRPGAKQRTTAGARQDQRPITKAGVER